MCVFVFWHRKMAFISKKFMCTILVVALLVHNVEATCKVKNNASHDIVIIPQNHVDVKIIVKAGVVVELPPAYLYVTIKNLGNGITSAPVKFADSTTVVALNGHVAGTINIYREGLVHGVISIVGSVIVCV